MLVMGCICRNIPAVLALFSAVILLAACSSGGGGDSLPGQGDHIVAYEVEGGSGIINEATIRYLDENGVEHTIEHASLERSNWSYRFRAGPDNRLLVSAMLKGEGSTTLYVRITVDDECWDEMRTFTAGSEAVVEGTARGILTECPSHGGSTVGP
ncbi:MAG TPA: MmpS family transport accessory protein [Deltaproteobacteria bacterium]|nr:MmpS family transport accessory protein [Deltaproteobacteria bacterium]